MASGAHSSSGTGWSPTAQRILAIADELVEAALTAASGDPDQHLQAMGVIDDLADALRTNDPYSQASALQLMPEKTRNRIQTFAQNPATKMDLFRAVDLAKSRLSAGQIRHMMLQGARQLAQTQLPSLAAKEASELAKSLKALSADQLLKGFVGADPQARETLRAILGTPTDPEFLARVHPYRYMTIPHLRESLMRARPELVTQLEEVAQSALRQQSAGPPGTTTPTSRGYGWLALPIALTALYFLLASRKEKPKTWRATSELESGR